MGIHWHNLGGAGGKCTPPVFYLRMFFVYCVEAGHIKKYEYFQTNYMGGVKIEKMKTLCFTGCRMEVSESPIYKEGKRCKLLLAKLRLCGNVQLLRRPERKG